MDGAAVIDVPRKNGPWSDVAWLGLLPGELTRDGGAPWAAVPPDPARAGRDADPLSPERVAQVLSDAGSPALGAFMAFRMRALARASLWQFALWFSMATFASPLLAVPFVVGTYSSRALGTVVASFLWSTMAWFVVNAFGTRVNSGHRDLAFEQFVRYALLLATNSSDTDSLVEHWERDSRCPCPAPTCLGRFRTTFARSLVVRTVYTFACLWTAYTFLAFYTQLVTLAGYTWTHAWSLAFAVLGLLARTMWYIAGALVLPMSMNAALLDVSSRLEVRAFDVSLGQLVESAAAAVSSFGAEREAAQEPTSLPSIAAGPYWIVHDALAPRMRTRFAEFRPNSHLVLAGIAIELISGFIYAVGSSCLPAWVLMSVATWISFALSDLVTVARANARAGAVADLHRAAAADLHRLVLSLPPTELAAPLRRQLLDRESALASVAGEAEHMRARFAGLVVDTGVVRTVLATGLTVGVALFGIVRGSVAVTLESVCNTA